MLSSIHLRQSTRPFLTTADRSPRVFDQPNAAHQTPLTHPVFQVLKLLCSILAMTPEELVRVQRGSRKAKGMIYGLLSASVSGWEAVTEAEIGEEWVKFLMDETDKTHEDAPFPLPADAAANAGVAAS